MFDVEDLGLTLGTGSKILDESKNEENIECPENPNNDKLILEQMIVDLALEDAMEDTLQDLDESTDFALLESLELLDERSIVRLDKKAKLNRATQLAVYAIARENNDRVMKKLVTVWKMERMLIRKLQKKYMNKARKRAKDVQKAAMKQAKGRTLRSRGKSAVSGIVSRLNSHLPRFR